MEQYGVYQLEGPKYQRICVIHSKRENKAFKPRIGEAKTMDWTHPEMKESCEKSYWRTNEREWRKRKSTYHVAG